MLYKIFTSKHKANTYSKHLTHSNDRLYLELSQLKHTTSHETKEYMYGSVEKNRVKGA